MLGSHRFSAFLGFVWLAGLLSAQNAQAPENPGTLIRSSVREVVLDVVVRHKNMSLADKLKATDFTVTEDGVPQTIKSFRFIGGRVARAIDQAPKQEAVGSAARVAADQANSTRARNFVSIVFDQIGADSRKNALDAAMDFLDQEFQDNTYAAIFRMNLRLNAIHGFSNDRVGLKESVRRALNGNATELASASANVLNQTDYTVSGGQGGIAVNSGIDLTQTPDFGLGSAGSNPLSESQQAIAGMIANQRGMVNYGTGMAVWSALLQIIRYESVLPGRKTILYLSDGLINPPGNHDFVQSVISAANRGNVTFYCIDVRGLTLATSNGVTSGLTATAAGISAGQGTMSNSPRAAMAQAGQFDLMDQALSAHGQLNMEELAKSTGGFAVFSTNDFKKNMARIMEDVRTHYEISYVPTSADYDGHFRKINVTLSDPKLIVQARDGYFAVPEIHGTPVQPYEMRALGVLNAGPRRDFDFQAGALRFKPVRNSYRFEMAFQVKTGSLTTPVDPNTHKARVHAIFLALIKDASGQVVDKVSRELDREFPEDKMELFRRGDTIYTSPFEAAAGRYTVDTAVIDSSGGRASTKRFALVVPKAEGPSVSSVEVIHDIVPLDSPRDPGNPLEFAGGKITPALTQTASAAKGTALFFVVYPNPLDVKPRVTVAFFHDGKEISRSTPDVGSIDEVNSFPMIESAKLPPGEYVARVTVEQAGRVTSQSTSISVTE
jgi:VWFA-related protein